MYKLTVSASKRYQITISNNLDGFGDVARKVVTGSKIAVVTDTNVDKLYGNALNGYLQGKTVYKYVVAAGEQSKSKDAYFQLLEQLCADGFSRTDTVIAFGGGVVGDLAGFVASTYMRGINFVQVPTTILSAVDSSVGGKTAINLDSGKNLVGTFYQPSAVYVSTHFFNTLPQREVLSGMGEIVKYAFLSKSVTLQMIENGADEQLVYQCLKIKRNVVQQDEKESGARALLNLGHTVGHAIESLSNYEFSHGECVVKGIAYAVRLSQKIYNLDQATCDKMSALLASCGHDLTCPFSVEQLIDKISHDKKGDGAAIKFVTVKDVGKPQIVKIDYQKLQEYLS